MARQPPRYRSRADRAGQRERGAAADAPAGGNGWRLAASRTAEGYRGGNGSRRSDPLRPAGPGQGAAPGWPDRTSRRGGGNGWDGGNGFYRPDRRRGKATRVSWWRHWTIGKIALLLGGAVALVVLAAVGAFFVAYSQVQVPLAALSKPLAQSSVVYFAGGRSVVGTFASQNRTLLTQAQVVQSKTLAQAVFAAEDRHFETEGGVSIPGTVRALLVDISGSGYQGASTITEQFVKNYFERNDSGNLTYKNKLKEIIVAIKLAKIRSKSWILTNYLNTIYLGSGAYGAQAAAETYFDVPAWQLSVAQAAMIGAMIQEPSAFQPDNPHAVIPGLDESLYARWQYVLANMVRDGAISQQTANAQQFPKVLTPKSAGGWNGFRGYVMAAVRQELRSRYGITPSQLDVGGYRIVTTVSLAKMRALYAAVGEVKAMMRADGTPFPGYAHIGALLEQPGTGAVLAWYGGPNFEAPHCGAIKCQYDMAMQSRNQVGSSFKPYVLSAAVAQGMNVQTSKLFGDSPACIPPDSEPTLPSIPGGNGVSCFPAHPDYLAVGFDDTPQGPITVANAAALSSNPAFEDLAHRVGTANIIKLAGQFGVNISPAAPDGDGSGLVDDVGKVGIALGIAPLTVEEQATTFATLANNGVYVTPHVVASIHQDGQVVPIRLTRRQVLGPAEAADVDWALSFDTQYGTAYPNAVLDPARPTIAKTGTTEFGQSAFFIGATPGQYSFAVGMFSNVQNDVPDDESLDVLAAPNGVQSDTGGAWPATLWRVYMTSVLAAKPIAQLPPLDITPDMASPAGTWIQLVPKPKHQHKHCLPQFGGPCPGPTQPVQPGQPSPGQTPPPPFQQQAADQPGQLQLGSRG